MAKNSFSLLEEEDSKNYKEVQHGIQANVWGSLSFLRLIGDIIELYLPKVVDSVLIGIGGKKK